MKKKVYFTSDWHLDHANCIKYDQRPFDSCEEMAEVLIKNFNYYVPEHGVTYFLGDMGSTSHGRLKAVMDRLNGTKILIRGNHDGNVYSMYAAGFDVVLQKAEITVAKHRVSLTHCPFKGVFREDTSKMRGHKPGANWHKEEHFSDLYSVEDEGQFLLHGHIHARKNKPHSSVKLDRQWDVGVVGNNYCPVSISEVESWIMRYNKNN